ncbi:hypothetical protein ABG067_002845 [Albugo candida]
MAWDGKSSMSQLRSSLKQRKKTVLTAVATLIALIIIITLSTTIGKSSSIKTQSNESPIGSKEGSPVTSPIGSKQGSQVRSPEVNDLEKRRSASKGVLQAEALSVPKSSSCTDPVSCQSKPGGNKADIAQKNSNPQPLAPSPTAKTVSNAGQMKFTDGWNNSDHWEYSDKSKVPASMFTASGITLNAENSKQPIRSKAGWSGEKILLVEWKRNELTDTNIWLLNTVMDQHFGSKDWPRRGELDIFEMFTQDKVNIPNSSQQGFDGVADRDYGQFTLHMGRDINNPCFCPASPSKTMWFGNKKPMVTSCGAQFPNSPRNTMAIIFLNEKNGQSLQLAYNPGVKKSLSKNGQFIYDIDITSSLTTTKVENNDKYFWGVPANNECVKSAGHDPKTGFPFFESFRLVLEEQLHNANAGFELIDFQVLRRVA